MTDKEQISRYWEFANQKQSDLYKILNDTFSELSDDIQAIFDRFMRIELSGALSKRETETLHREIRRWQDAGYSDSYQLKLYMRDMENRSRIKGHEALFLYLFAAFAGRYRGLMIAQLPILQAIAKHTFERDSQKKWKVTGKELNSLLSNLPDGTSYEDQMFGYAQYGAKRTADTVRNTKQREVSLEADSPEMQKILSIEKNRLLKPSQSSAGQPQNYHGYLDFVMTSVVGYSAIRAFQASGSEEYIFIATIDGRTTEACKHLNQKRFKVSEMRLGINVPPITVDWRGQPIPHPCRSIIKAAPSLKPNPKDDTIAFEENCNIFDAERDIVNKKREYGIAFDSHGKILFQIEGNSHNITPTVEQEKMLRDAIFSHNHPSDVPLSDKDLYAVWRYGLKEVKAVTQDGVYSISAPKVWKRNLGTAEKLHQEYIELIDKFTPSLLKRVDRGLLTMSDANILGQRLIMRRITRKYGTTMKFIKWGDLDG